MISSNYLDFETNVDDIIDLTGKVANAVQVSGLQSGIAVIFVPGSTGAVTTIEHEQGLVQDIRAALEWMAPENIEYAHDERWHDGNGHSHVRASIIGPSLVIPFANGKPLLGTWQQIVFIEMDNRPRKRRIIVQILGE